jgi:glycosyltransferase involved in cell wall biosynthesis
MTKPKVLYVCHNHPRVRPGGAEAYALELYHGMRLAGEFEPLLLVKGGPPLSDRRPSPGTLFGVIDEDPNQHFFYTELFRFDPFYGAVSDKRFYTRHFRDYLLAARPDVVHFQHTWFLGYELIREVRNTLPDAPILYTLHEYLPICHRSGQMVQADTGQPCLEASPESCHRCFPRIAPSDFVLRRRFIQSQLSLVDQFIAPSSFLRDRYVAWGIPTDKIRVEEYGRAATAWQSRTVNRGQHQRFGFFGQFTMFKGVDTLLRAMACLQGISSDCPSASEQNMAGKNGNGVKTSNDAVGAPHLWLHGANLDLQPGNFQNEIRGLLDATRNNVTLVGRYDAGDVPRLMENIDWVVVPSIWWENSPLVIQEAFGHGRPVLCSDIGGMAEKVTHQVNGLHFRAGDPKSLAAAMHRAATTPGLWDRLRQGISPVYSMEQHVNTLTKLYRELCDQSLATAR